MNHVEIKFDNDILADIIHISDFGKYLVKFDTERVIQPPKNAVDVLGMLFSLLEENPETPQGRVYLGNQQEILHRTITSLPEVISNFNNIEVIITINSEDEDGNTISTQSVTNITVSETQEELKEETVQE